MKAKALTEFDDLKEKVKRKKDDEFTVSKDRFREINSTKYGKLVSEVKEPKKAEK